MATCNWCTQVFTPKRADRATYCGRGCASRAYAERRRAEKPAPVLTAVCGCGCEEPMPEFDAHGRRRRYLYRHNPKTRPVRTCETCEKEFQHKGASKFCSRACSARSRVVTKVDLVCLACGEDYLQFPYRAETSKYCSKACWAKRAPQATCLNCGEEFTAYDGGAERKYCSVRCTKKHMVGALAPRWKGGITPENQLLRSSAALRKWRLAVYKRDGYQCQDCGAKGELHAHHIKFWSTHPELRFEVSNGKTLCIDCHGGVHGRNFRGVKNSTPSKKRRRPESRPAQSVQPSVGQ